MAPEMDAGRPAVVDGLRLDAGRPALAVGSLEGAQQAGEGTFARFELCEQACEKAR